MIKLNVGCAFTSFPDEIGVDMEPGPFVKVQADVHDLPFRHGTVDFIRFDNVLEHLPQRDALLILTGLRRLLKKDGRIYVGVPDFPKMCRTYLGMQTEEGKLKIIRNFLGSQVHDGEFHRSIWDMALLKKWMTLAGFVGLKEHEDLKRDHATCIAVEGSPRPDLVAESV